MSTREALFAVRTLIQRRYRNIKKDMYAYTIDYHEASDFMNDEKLIEILKRIPIDKNDLLIISQLY